MNREHLIAHLRHMLIFLENPDVNSREIEEFLWSPYPCVILQDADPRRLQVIEEKLNALLERPVSASCLYSGEDRDRVLNFMGRSGEVARKDSLLFLSNAVAGAKHLTICDPYFLRPYGKLPLNEYQAAIESVLPQSLRSLELFVKPRERTKEVAEAFNAYCMRAKIKLLAYKTRDIHDRVWIRDHSDAYAVGTSFNGLGNKCAFILPLPIEDLRTFQSELQTVRESSGCSKSA